jgi:hypothetical protein
VPNAVGPLAERLRRDGRQAKAECRRQKAKVGIHPFSFFLHSFLCAPLNRERRFIPLRLDVSSPTRLDDALNWQRRFTAKRALQPRSTWAIKPPCNIEFA